MAGKILLAFLGLSAGGIVSAGIFAFLTVIGMIQRLADKTRTVKALRLYEDCIIAGGTCGNLLFLYEIPLTGAGFLMVPVGLCYGIFIGCLIMSLAETLNAFPVMCRRLHISFGFAFLVLALALGKGIGSFVYYWFS